MGRPRRVTRRAARRASRGKAQANPASAQAQAHAAQTTQHARARARAGPRAGPRPGSCSRPRGSGASWRGRGGGSGGGGGAVLRGGQLGGGGGGGGGQVQRAREEAALAGRCMHMLAEGIPLARGDQSESDASGETRRELRRKSRLSVTVFSGGKVSSRPIFK